MNDRAKKIRKDILRISHESGHGHIPSCFSVVELLCGVYDTMNHRPSQPSWDGRDIFVLSKGHASLAHYCVLAEYGYIDVKGLSSFGAHMSDYGCHADCLKVPGVEVSTGSLGHGIGVAVGIALAFKIRKSARKVYVVIGDGEANEGSVWEALMVASGLKLDNLTVILDNNKSQSRGLEVSEPEKKFSAFGCAASTVNGHDIEALKKALREMTGAPRAIVADTVKGYGSKTLSGNMFEWHRKAPNKEQLEALIKELDEKTV